MNNYSRTVLMAAVALLIAGVVGAQSFCGSGGIVQATAPWYCSSINQGLTAYWSRWAPIALLAVMVSFAIASVIFGAGVFIRSDRIRNFGIGEYYEAIANALIVVGFLFLSAVMFGIITGAVTGPVNPYSTALNYLSTTISGVYGELQQLFTIAAVDGFYVTMNFQYCSTAGCHTVPQFWAWTVNRLVYIPTFVLIDAQFDVLALLYAEFWIILEFMYIAIPVFLIPGVLLRSLIPTRGLGGMMIAVAIGFYMVMPLLFSVAYYFTNAQTQQCTSGGTLALQQYGSGVGAQTNGLSPSSPLVQALNGIQVCMNSYWLSVLFYPSLIMALTYAVIIQTAEFIGGMAQPSRWMRV